MNVSSNELQMVVLKACRGVGVPIAQAQEVAAAVAASPQSIPDLLKHLSQPFQKAEFDFTTGLKVKNINILIDFPACADAAQQGVGPIILRGVGTCGLISALARNLEVTVEARSNDLTVSKCIKSKILPKRCSIIAKEWMALNQYAALTYVPENDQSRVGGAGAGLTDND